MEENKELMINESKGIRSFEDYNSNSNTNVETLSNIKDSKKIFNLGVSVDCKINDCIGEKLRIKEVLIRKYTKPLTEAIVNEETGDVKDFETSVSCVLVDENGKSYATGSKTFTYNLINYLVNCGGASILDSEGIEIQIVNVTTPNGNKALSFKLL